jgi:hypothetical protein
MFFIWMERQFQESSNGTGSRPKFNCQLFCQEQFADRSVCETPTRVLNQSSAIIQIVFFLVLVCVFDSQARKSPHGEVNRAAHG